MNTRVWVTSTINIDIPLQWAHLLVKQLQLWTVWCFCAQSGSNDFRCLQLDSLVEYHKKGLRIGSEPQTSYYLQEWQSPEAKQCEIELMILFTVPHPSLPMHFFFLIKKKNSMDQCLGWVNTEKEERLERKMKEKWLFHVPPVKTWSSEDWDFLWYRKVTPFLSVCPDVSLWAFFLSSCVLLIM